MSKTLSEIQDRLSPGRLLDQTLGYFSGKSTDGSGFAENFSETIKHNPVPTTLIGLGLGWLMIAGKRDTYGEVRRYPSYSRPGYSPHMSDSTADRLKEKASSATAEVKGKISAGLDSTKETIEAARDSISHHASHQTERVQQNFNYLLHEQPLVLIGAGLALGAALGAGLPPTHREDRLMGETRDKLVDQTAETGSGQLEKAKAVASAAVESASKAADREEIATPKTMGVDKAEEARNPAPVGGNSHH